MLFAKIALRNIGSHRRKNFIVFSVTALVCFFLFIFLSFSDGELENIKNGVSSFYSPYSDIKAVTPDYLHLKEQEEDTREEVLTEITQLKKDLASFPFIKESISRVWNVYVDFFANGQKYMDFNFAPLDGDDETLRSKYRIFEGRDIARGETGVILMHASVRKYLPIALGDEITVVGKDFFSQVTSKKLTVVGFYAPYSDNPNLPYMCLVPVEDIAVLAGYSSEEANQMLIRLAPHIKIKTALAELRAWAEKTGAPIHFYSTSDDNQQDSWGEIYGMIRYIILSMVILTLFITAFGIMNVVSVNLFERRKEIGTYFCLGTETPFLMAAYTTEIFIVNLAGSLAGIALGLGTRAIVNAVHITSTDPGFQVVMGGSVFKLGLSPSTVLYIIGGICIITVLTALTTLGKALQVSPVVAVRETE